MPRPSTATHLARHRGRPVVRRTRAARRVTVAAALVALACAACSTSAPADLGSSAGTTIEAPAPTPTESLLASDDPTTSTVGGLAPGFPSDLFPVPAGAHVLVSSATPDGDLTDVSLNLTTDASTKELLADVRGPLLDAGFTEKTPDEKEPQLAAQAAFTRDGAKEIVILGILDRDGTRTLTLSGTVSTS
ncbi:hypothetical protein [Cellulomonas sp. HZM]|uniref:hypothetical protein n=1 Tax=Cellulomonas sp. HZM TaxID=1454010 RepID=UPI0012DFAB58|nr:hypothetical protein [Cellulomonas sp. HZM]